MFCIRCSIAVRSALPRGPPRRRCARPCFSFSTQALHRLNSSPSSQSPPPSPASPPPAVSFPTDAAYVLRPPSVWYLTPAEQRARDEGVLQHLERRRAEQAAFEDADGTALKVAIDLSYFSSSSVRVEDALGKAKDTTAAHTASSLATQLSFVVSHNRAAAFPACLHLTSVHPRLLTARPNGEERAEAESSDDAALSTTEARAGDAFVDAMNKRRAQSWRVHRSTRPVHQRFPAQQVHLCRLCCAHRVVASPSLTSVRAALLCCGVVCCALCRPPSWCTSPPMLRRCCGGCRRL